MPVQTTTPQTPPNPVEEAAIWAGMIDPSKHGSNANYSALARFLGVSRQAIQKYRRKGEFPKHHYPELEKLKDKAFEIE